MKDLATKRVLLKGGVSGGLYSLPVSGPAAFLSSKTTAQVLHDRLGHPHARVLHRCLQSCSVDRSSVAQFNSVCAACQMGKSARFALPRVVRSSGHILDLVYTDIWGPSPVLSSDVFRYFVIFVDDYSRFTWFYPMRLKSDINSIFDSFRALVERRFSTAIKSVQSDLGKKY